MGVVYGGWYANCKRDAGRYANRNSWVDGMVLLYNNNKGRYAKCNNMIVGMGMVARYYGVVYRYTNRLVAK